MTVTDVRKDLDALTLTITSDFTAEPARVWQLWADPRQLERWWGPPGYPATVSAHDLQPGGVVRYFMTGPEGERFHAWWRVREVAAPHALEFDDGFGEEPGADDLPVTLIRVTLESHGDGTRMVIRSRFASAAAMEQLLAMGMDEGMVAALGQTDALLAESEV